LSRPFGFFEVAASDASDYEAPTVLHDFNTPLPPGFDRRHIVVFNGESLEHIFCLNLGPSRTELEG
jgi:hypothetical protein